ncbi:MAG: hypothetical protein E7311_04175 [Clostridiales bacterium]|nr:hypothetical protein [Clostridiales bacterium]
MIKTKRWVIILIFVAVIVIAAVSCIFIFNSKNKENNKIVENNEIESEEKIELEESKEYEFILDIENSDLNIKWWSFEGKEKEEAALVKDLFQKIVDGEVHTPNYNFMVVGTCILNGNKSYVIQAGIPSNMGEYYIVDISKGIDNALVFYGGWHDVHADMIELEYKFLDGKVEKQGNEIKGEKLVQFDTVFYKLEDVALEWVNSVDVKDFKEFNYDLDGDGNKEIITLRKEEKNGVKIKNIDGEWENIVVDVVELNGEKFEENWDNPNIYIVDLNENDKKLEIIIFDEGASDDPGYAIYTKRGNKMEKLTYFGGYHLRIDKNGLIIYDDTYNGSITPNIYFEYYEIYNSEIEKKNINIDKIRNVDFTDNIGMLFSENHNNFMEFWNYYDGFNHFDAYKKANIEIIGDRTFKILDIEDNVERIKIKLEDGREGYMDSIQLAGA